MIEVKVTMNEIETAIERRKKWGNRRKEYNGRDITKNSEIVVWGKPIIAQIQKTCACEYDKWNMCQTHFEMFLEHYKERGKIPKEKEVKKNCNHMDIDNCINCSPEPCKHSFSKIKDIDRRIDLSCCIEWKKGLVLKKGEMSAGSTHIHQFMGPDPSDQKGFLAMCVNCGMRRELWETGEIIEVCQ